MVILTIILVQVLCCHSITKITRNGINGAMFVSESTGYAFVLVSPVACAAMTATSSMKITRTQCYLKLILTAYNFSFRNQGAVLAYKVRQNFQQCVTEIFVINAWKALGFRLLAAEKHQLQSSGSIKDTDPSFVAVVVPVLVT